MNSLNPDSPWKGSVWTFTVSPYLVVDNFESYTDDGNLEQTWVPNTTGYYYINLETTVVNTGGTKSMRLEYENEWTPYFTEATALTSKLAIGSNWTQAGAKALVLWTRGTNNNATKQPLYLKLTDNSGHTAKIFYPDPNIEREDLWLPWHVWRIDLTGAAFTSLNKANIASITIGVGDSANPAPQIDPSRDMMYFDDIRLYPSSCTGDANYGPVGDLTGDCHVDYNDVNALANVWLQSSQTITATTPSSTGLTGWWKFDESSGNTSADSSGNNHPAGIGVGVSRSIAGGVDGSNALSFSGAGDVTINKAAISTFNTQCTISFWANGDSSLPTWVNSNPEHISGAFFSYGTNHCLLAAIPYDMQGTVIWSAGTSWNNGIGKVADSPSVLKGQWNHWAFTKNSTSGEMKIYLNGQLWHSGTGETLGINGAGSSRVRIGSYNSVDFYKGKMDEVRMYNRELSQAEIVSLANKTSVTQPLTYPAFFIDSVLSKDGQITLKDYAVMANHWLEKKMWPQSY